LVSAVDDTAIVDDLVKGPTVEESSLHSHLATVIGCDMVCSRERSMLSQGGAHMADREPLARVYHASITRLVRDGRAPHYTELATELNLSPEDARVALHDLEKAGVPGFWIDPGTDIIGSLAPFNNLPTQYRISVDGEQRWYGQ
jgi:hypothetical protein